MQEPRTFQSGTWAQLRNTLPRPAVVVFTTTDCSFCPEVIDSVAASLRSRKGMSAILAIVVMDGAHQPLDWLAEPHYTKADRLYVFKGRENALRHEIDPGWRGMTPYVAVLGKKGGPKFFIGSPTSIQLESVLRP